MTVKDIKKIISNDEYVKILYKNKVIFYGSADKFTTHDDAKVRKIHADTLVLAVPYLRIYIE